jgi:hypothetical protein
LHRHIDATRRIEKASVADRYVSFVRLDDSGDGAQGSGFSGTGWTKEDCDSVVRDKPDIEIESPTLV